jgi:hypothetical protein
MVLKRELSANHWNVCIVSLQMCATYNKGLNNFLLTSILLCALYSRIQDELAPKGCADWPDLNPSKHLKQYHMIWQTVVHGDSNHPGADYGEDIWYTE